jgi:outer membrane immunogenic protein
MLKVAARAGVCALAVLSGLITPAAAADRAWTGFYIGPHIGGAWTEIDKSLSTPSSISAPYFLPGDAAAIGTAGQMGWREGEVSIGGQVGYNIQMNGVVFGAEADIGRLGLDARSSVVEATPAAGDVNMATSVKASYLATLRGRLGLVVGDGLVYVTGGLAYSKVTLRQRTTFTGVSTDDDASASDHAVGWTVGGGVEYALDRNWTIKAEYLYADLGSFRATTYAVSPYVGDGRLIPFNHSVDLTAQIARVGLNYRF